VSKKILGGAICPNSHNSNQHTSTISVKACLAPYTVSELVARY